MSKQTEFDFDIETPVQTFDRAEIDALFAEYPILRELGVGMRAYLMSEDAMFVFCAHYKDDNGDSLAVITDHEITNSDIIQFGEDPLQCCYLVKLKQNSCRESIVYSVMHKGNDRFDIEGYKSSRFFENNNLGAMH